ncbi:hypothetical protein Tco_0121597 [Tanacetum coccineum]
MTKSELIKVVLEEAEKAGIDPKIIESAKGGEQFKKIQDPKHQVLKREQIEKAKRPMKLKRKRIDNYIWTMTNKLKPEPITDVKILPNSRPVVLIVYRGEDRRNFKTHNPFRFADFGITELDELGPIIEKKKNRIVKDLMISLDKRYERLIKIPEELEIQSALHAPALEQAPSQSSGRKRKHVEWELEI